MSPAAKASADQDEHAEHGDQAERDLVNLRKALSMGCRFLEELRVL
ncbi:MAG: hypothetical protein WDN24_07515 [Sphingomonas sp.]